MQQKPTLTRSVGSYSIWGRSSDLDTTWDKSVPKIATKKHTQHPWYTSKIIPERKKDSIKTLSKSVRHCQKPITNLKGRVKKTNVDIVYKTGQVLSISKKSKLRNPITRKHHAVCIIGIKQFTCSSLDFVMANIKRRPRGLQNVYEEVF